MSDATPEPRKPQLEPVDLGGAQRLLGWANEVLTEAGVEATGERTTDIARRLATLVVGQRFVQLAQENGSAAYEEWLATQTEVDPLEHFDLFRVALVDSIAATGSRTTVETAPQASREAVDGGLVAILETELAATKPEWVQGAAAEFGATPA